jgi:hypothetical protein
MSRFGAWFVPTPVERERARQRRDRIDRIFDLIDRIFKVAGWLLIIGAFGALARKLPQGSPGSWILVAIIIILYIAFNVAVIPHLVGPLSYILDRYFDQKGFLKRLVVLPLAVMIAIAIQMVIVRVIAFSILTVFSAERP